MCLLYLQMLSNQTTSTSTCLDCHSIYLLGKPTCPCNLYVPSHLFVYSSFACLICGSAVTLVTFPLKRRPVLTEALSSALGIFPPGKAGLRWWRRLPWLLLLGYHLWRRYLGITGFLVWEDPFGRTEQPNQPGGGACVGGSTGFLRQGLQKHKSKTKPQRNKLQTENAHQLRG